MEENWLTAYPANVHDLIVTPKSKEVKVWLDKEDVGLELSFRRVTISELDQLLSRDRERQEKTASERMQEALAQMPPEHREFIEQALRESRSQRRQLPQEKLNRYLAFVESGEILESYPDAKNRAVAFRVVFKFQPDASGCSFLARANAVVQSAGISWRQEVFADSHDN